jgi:type IV pilus assembly protein PilN
MRISLNLATRPFADVGPAMKRLRIAMGILLLITIGLLLGLRHFEKNAEAARARNHSLDIQIAQIANERESYRELMRQPANARLLQQAATLNRLFDEKSFSWTLAMEDLETVLPGGVQVSTLEPARNKTGQITLHLRVIGPRDKAVELVRNLEHSKRFLSPRIVGENAEAAQLPGERQEPVSESNKVDFELLAEYNPASPGERKAVKKQAGVEETSVSPEGEMNQHRVRAVAVRPQAGKRFSAGHGPGRMPYTGSPQPLTPPNSNPGLIRDKIHPTPGGPQ